MSKKSSIQKKSAKSAPCDPTQQDALNDAAEQFSRNFADAEYEMGEAQNFVRELCGVYGLNYLHAVDFERRVQKRGGKGARRIDGFFPGLLLVEMKSKGENLDEAYVQAKSYIPLLKNKADRPRHILVSDFQHLHLYDETGENAPVIFALADFRAHVNELDFLLGYERIIAARNEAATITAATMLGNLHDSIKATGYVGNDLQTMLVRLLFCLFADDTALFGEDKPFSKLIADSRSDGDDLGGRLQRMFNRLDTNPNKLNDPNLTRQRTDGQYAYLASFPYVNGAVFSKRIADCDLDANSRAALMACCDLDWADISPDIFGTLFQHIMHWDDEAATGKTKKRRDFGAHYTSERNIQRAIRPLFLDELKAELDACKGNKKSLVDFQHKLSTLNIFDPACGCGNFLVVAYRELRMIEQQVLLELKSKRMGGQARFPECDVHQFHGIEIDPTAVEIATVALWLTDHQMNMRYAEGYHRIPLHNKANIVCGNALRTDWSSVIVPAQCSYIVGNPPFIGHQWRSAEQVEDMNLVWGIKGRFGRLDYVTCWFNKAAAFAQHNEHLKIALVSTNSICQGEQVGILWPHIFAQKLYIHFAHRTFKWSNEGSGVAAVHCVIIGLGMNKPKKCTLWDYSDNISSDAKPRKAKCINAYLVDAANVILDSRTDTPQGLPQLKKGSQPTDGGFFVLNKEEKAKLENADARVKTWIRPYIGGEEFINSKERWCLWLKDVALAEIEDVPLVMERVQAVAAVRLESPTPSVRAFADQPTLFTQDRQPSGNYLVIPEVSSENRRYLPIGFLSKNNIASNQLQITAGGTLYHFAVLCSTMHNAWMRTTCGRLKSDYRYAPSVYNNFPWPQTPLSPPFTKGEAQRAASATQGEDQHAATISHFEKGGLGGIWICSDIAAAGQAVLDARALHQGKSLAWLYNPDTMPANLQDAHDEVDALVDEAYGYEGGDDDASRVAFLFERYQALVSPLIEAVDEEAPPKKPR